MAPQTDIELALFRVQENEKQKQFFQQNQLQMHPQQQDVQRQSETLTPGRQLTLANQTIIADHQLGETIRPNQCSKEKPCHQYMNLE